MGKSNEQGRFVNRPYKRNPEAGSFIPQSEIRIPQFVGFIEFPPPLCYIKISFFKIRRGGSHG